jgi:hypothetical protein
MLANGLIQIQQGEGFNNFWVMRKEEENVTAEGTISQ